MTSSSTAQAGLAAAEAEAHSEVCSCRFCSFAPCVRMRTICFVALLGSRSRLFSQASLASSTTQRVQKDTDLAQARRCMHHKISFSLNYCTSVALVRSLSSAISRPHATYRSPLPTAQLGQTHTHICRQHKEML